MRDQDMADVDVTSPGIWERESDALYEDLVRREEQDEAAGLPPQENASRPRARGQRLTEEHLKLWTSMVRHQSLYFVRCLCIPSHTRTRKSRRHDSKH